MLKLNKINKNYDNGDIEVKALQDIDIEFRENEFVSILGPSGGGKTTLLNIIGGLDHYTSGDLIINGVSTKKYKDRDWDTYRNHSIGFVFQSYNLIPHQSVLANVELALTLSGVGKSNRKKRAIEALKSVGLEKQINKKPNQLSGGQMQRVAIARALVNNPDILLADEPTGALDTATSVQIMDLLKEIAKDKLVIMVTHNPELAEKYSTRIIKILDGKIINDSNPYKNKEENINNDKKEKATSMNFFTALSLSFKNLLTKKGRTILTSFAGSIGIIGIAAILALSNGVQNYINMVEEDTLSSYPITIEKSTVDMTSMMEAMMGQLDDGSNHEEGKIYSADIMNDMISTLSNKIESNNLNELKKYLEDENNEIIANSNAVKYNYDLKINLYNENVEEKIVQVNPSTVMNALGMGEMIDARNNSSMSSMFGSSSMMMSNTDVWIEMLDNEELLHSQYDIVAGKWPKSYNEVVLIVDSNNNISDYTLYALGIKDQEELKQKWDKVIKGEKVEEEVETTSYTYDELLNLSFKLILNSDYYEKNNGVWINKQDDEEYMKNKINEADSIKVVGIIKQNEETVATSMSGGIGYLKDLKEYVINKSNESQIVKEQKENNQINIFSGLEFPKEGENANFNINNLTDEQRLQMSKLDSQQLAQLMEAYTQNKNATYEKNLEKLGAIDLENPTSIYIYPKSFEAKENIQDAIEKYNQKQRDDGKEENVINYTDLVGTMISSVTKIIDVISYVLIAFVSISLVVSSIMIGIITYISVLERTKEIGILRAIGASKRDISRVFNAETLIIGLIAGLLGIGVTVLLTIPANVIIKALTNVSNLASVPFGAGVILVAISVILTVFAGLIPAKIAAKKDPVEALRTE